MSNQSYGAQMQALTADAALIRDYFDPATIKIGDVIPYRDEADATDDRAWNDAMSKLRARGLDTTDNGDGYTVVAAT